MTNKTKIILALSIFIIIVTFIYQHACLDYVRKDGIGFMTERNSFKSNWSWILHGINYDRTRLVAPGDYFMYRPGYWLYNALNVLIKEHQILTGIISILLHLLVVVLLYYIFKLNPNGLDALPFAAVLASQYVGIEMISWRYASCYMLCISLILTSFLILFSRLRYKYYLVSFLLISSTFFHEIITGTMILFIVISFPILKLSKQEKSYNNSHVMNLIGIFTISIITYFLLNFINWKATHPPSFFGPADHFSPNINFIKNSIHNFFHYLGAGTRAFFNPFSIQLKWDQSLYDWAYYYWDIREDNIKSFYLWSVLGVSILTLTITISLRKIFLQQAKSSEIIALWASCSLITLASLYSIVRLTCRDISYAKTSSACYYWFFSFFYIIIIKFIIDEIFTRIPLNFLWKRILSWIIYTFLAFFVIAQGLKARNAIDNNYDLTWAKQIQQAIQTSDLYFRLNPNKCLDSSERYPSDTPRNRQFFTLPYYLSKYNCGIAPGSTVVHLYRTEMGVTVLRLGPYPSKFEN